jgi:hypothetical protein
VGRLADLLSLGLAFQMVLLVTIATSFNAIGAIVDPAFALPVWYDVHLPLAIACLVAGVVLARWALARWPHVAPGGAWNVALLAFGVAILGTATGGLIDVLTGPPAEPALASIGQAIGWGLGVWGGLVVGRRRAWLVRDGDDDRVDAAGSTLLS